MTLVLAWGAFAFGAVYDWALLPLAAAVIVMAIAQVARHGWRRDALSPRWLLLFAAVGLQLVPIPSQWLDAISPQATTFLLAYDVAFGNQLSAYHPLSIDPTATIRGAGFLVLAVAALVASSRTSPGFHRALARNIVIVGGVLAFVGLAQKATFNGKLLWFWTPVYYSWNSFGPFVNRNHFAGWMLLATSIAIGHFLALTSSTARRWPATWRARLLWLDTRDAMPLVFTAAAVMTMLCSILWTMSRSGIAGTGVSTVILIGAAVRGGSGGARRTAIALALASVIVGGIAWRGADTLVNWYQKTNTLEWRINLWEDSAPVIVDFWPTGTGFNTYGPAMVMYPRTDMSVRPLEAHSDYLQLAVEGGLLVGVAAILLVTGVGRDIRRRFRQRQDDAAWWIRMGAVAGICGIAVQELTDFSLQIPGVAVLFAATLAIALHDPAWSEQPVRRQRRADATLVSSI